MVPRNKAFVVVTVFNNKAREREARALSCWFSKEKKAGVQSEPLERGSVVSLSFIFTNPPEDNNNNKKVQSEPNPACWGVVCAGADWSLFTLAPTPTAGLHKKEDKQIANSARMHFIEGNNN